MAVIRPDNYWNRFDPKKNYVEVLLRDGYASQASEINEIQSIIDYRLSRLGGALFKDGDIVSSTGQIVVNPETGHVTAEDALVYIGGTIYDVPAAEFDIARDGVVSVGVVLTTKVISEKEDAGLYNPAIGSRNEGEPGAWRKQVTARWGVEADAIAVNSDTASAREDAKDSAQYCSIYDVVDGVLQPKEAPPTIDTFTSALARYDRDSTGTGTYVVSGLTLVQQEPLEDGRLVYSLSEGRGRVDGIAVEFSTSQRVIDAAEPDLRVIDTEVHTATAASTSGGQRIDVAHVPLHSVVSLRITTREKATMIHGAYQGVSDSLPSTSVVSIVSVSQGSLTYTEGVDFVRNGDRIDWSPSGNEPASGSTYEVEFDHVVSADPTAIDQDGFTVQGAVSGTSILVTYEQALPRYDRLALTNTGGLTWIRGIAAETGARIPEVPSGMLGLATVYQSWRPGSQVVTNDGVRVVPFDEIVAINNRIDYLLQEVSRQRLEADVATREAGARVGMFVDPLLDDSMRDQGIEQDAAIVYGDLTLPVPRSSLTIQMPDGDITVETTLAYTVVPEIEQLSRTGEMQVNPYMAFDVLPAKVTLSPAVDRWTETRTTWASSVTQEFKRSTGTGGGSGWAVVHHVETTTSTQTLSSSSTALKYLRQRQVSVSIEGFGPGEVLDHITFDGITVSAS